MLVATFAVLGLPLLIVTLLRELTVVTSDVALPAIAVGVGLGASRSAGILWAARHRGGDSVFGDLMAWSWLRRRRNQPLTTALRLQDRGVSRISLHRPRAAQAGGEITIPDLKQREHLLQQVVRTLEVRHPPTYGHSGRVARYATAMAEGLGLPPEQVERIRVAAAVHDIGKIAAPLRILDKPGKLNEAELALIQQHSVVGAKTVASMGDDELVGIVRHHHERLDGNGYPDGLEGSQIPIGARIVAVADTFDAVTSPRAYHPAKTHWEALQLLSAEAGTQLDPDAVQAFRAYYFAVLGSAVRGFLHHGRDHLSASLHHSPAHRIPAWLHRDSSYAHEHPGGSRVR
jgi:putative nucleotidyltransferase with HDIG domain